MWRGIRLHGFRSKFYKNSATELSVQTDIQIDATAIYDEISFDPVEII